MAAELKDRLSAISVSDDGDASIAALRAVVFAEGSDAESIKVKESALDRLTAALVTRKDAQGLSTLLDELRPLFATVPKAKTAKIVRNVVAAIARIPDTDDLLETVLDSQIAWATESKRTFLRQRLETRLSLLLLSKGEFQRSLALLSRLLTEVKKVDDKVLLVDVFLAESRAHAAVRNFAKSRASLTAGRAAAAAVYVPPAVQAELDLQSGVLHAEERDYVTAYSYLFEAFEALDGLGAAEAPRALKLMLLCKVLSGDPHEVPALASSRAGLRHAGRQVDAAKAVGKALEARSLEDFEKALATYDAELRRDPLAAPHLERLYATMLTRNLARIIEPYSRVEVSYVAERIGLPAPEVERRLGRMILDGELRGTLDQGQGVLQVHGPQESEGVYKGILETLQSVRNAVDILHERSAKVVQGGVGGGTELESIKA